MATSKPKYLPGQDPTCHARDAITGARFVKLDTSVDKHADGHAQVTPAGAGEFAVGVAAYDAADETKVLVFCEGVVEVLTGEAVGHGDLICSGAAGVAMKADDTSQYVLGIAWEDAADASLCQVKLFPAGARLLAATAVVGDQTAVVHLTDSTGGTGNDTVAAIAAPTDTPATADALRDDIAAVMVPALNNNFADLTAKVNTILTRLESAGLLTP